MHVRTALRHAADDVSSSRFDELFSLMFLLWNRDRIVEGVAWAAEFQHRPVVDPAARVAALGFAAVTLLAVDLTVAQAFAETAENLWASTASTPPVVAISVTSTVELMRGQTEAAIANCQRVYALAAEEPDLFVRVHALSQCLMVLNLCDGSTRLPDLHRDLLELVDRLGNNVLLAMVTASLAVAEAPTDPDRSIELLLQAYALNEEFGAKPVNASLAMFLALHELSTGHKGEAAHWARRGLELSVTYGTTYTAQLISVAVPIVKRHSPDDAAVLLGALRAHRTRTGQAGTELEAATESRQEASLRRATGDEFDLLHAQGLALSEADMLALAFTQLDTIIDDVRP